MSEYTKKSKLRSKRKVSRSNRSRLSEAGNVFFTLFGAVAVVGVLGAGIMATMRGPLSTMVEVNRREQAKAEIRVAASLILATSAGSDVCGDGDGLTEGVNPGNNVGLSGGGAIPGSVAVAKNDPWGNPYGYCAWDHGIDGGSSDGGVGAGTCAADKVLAGDTDTNKPAIFVVSAGPNGIFDTTCAIHNTYVGDDTNGAGDDIAQTMSYNDAVSGSGGLWGIKPLVPDTAQIDENIEVLGTGTSSFAGGATFQDVLQSQTAVATDRIDPLTPASQDYVAFGTGSGSGIKIGDVAGAQCAAAGDIGILSVNQTTGALEICNGTNFVGAGLWNYINATDIHFGTSSAVNVGIGTSSPNNTLDVVGTAEVSGLATLESLAVTNASTLGGLLTVNAASNLNSNVVITGSTADNTTDALTVRNLSGAIDILVAQNDGMVGIGTAGPNDQLDVAGVIDASNSYKLNNVTMLDDAAGTAGTVLLGQSAGALTTGDNNTILGAGAGATLAAGTGNIVIGQGADVTVAGATNEINIGNTITGDLAAGDIEIDNDLTVGNDLTVSGDDIIMANNDGGDVLLSDGTAFGPTTLSGDIASISNAGAVTIANDAVSEQKLNISNAPAADECLKYQGGSLSWDACSGSGGGDGLGGNGLTEVLAVNNDANNLKITDLADPTLAQDAATKNYVDTQVGGLSQDRIEDTGDQNTYIDVDTDNADGNNTITMATAGTERINIGATGITSIYGDAHIGGTFTVDAQVLAVDPTSDSVGIGTATPASTALLDMTSTTKGLLTPRMTIAQRDVIVSPATGLTVFTTDAGDNGIFQFYDGTDWIDVGAGGAEGAGIWQEDGTNNYIEYDDGLGGMRVGKVTGQPAPATDWQLDIGNSVVYTSSNKVAIGSGVVSGTLTVDVTGNVGATNYCDAAGDNCFTAATVTGGGGGLWNDDGPEGPAEIYYNGGNIGVGTNNPDELIHASGGNIKADRDNPSLILEDTTCGTDCTINLTSENGDFNVTANDNGLLINANDTRIRLNKDSESVGDFKVTGDNNAFILNDSIGGANDSSYWFDNTNGTLNWKRDVDNDGTASETFLKSVAGQIGIGPSVGTIDTLLEVAGSIKIADGAEACNAAAHEGAIRYLAGSDEYQVCASSVAGWETISAGSNLGAAGADTEVQFNDGGTNLGADADFTYDKTNNVLTVQGTLAARDLVRITGQAGSAPTYLALNDIGDVDTAGVSDGDLLYYNNGTGNWETVDPASLSGAAAGADREIQFNNGGVLGASSTYMLMSDGDLLLTGTHTGTASVPATGAGTRMFFDTQTSALRAGGVSGTQWNDTNIGAYSVALGEDTIARGTGSVALTRFSSATGNDSIAIGNNASASAYASTAIGWLASASQTASTALGRDVTSSGANSLAIGVGAAAGTNPIVSGAGSVGIFMGDQSGADITTDNVMSILGGNVGIGTDAPLETLQVDGGLAFNAQSHVIIGFNNYWDDVQARDEFMGLGTGNKYMAQQYFNPDNGQFFILNSTTTGDLGDTATLTPSIMTTNDSRISLGGTSVDGTLRVDVNGDIGAVQYCNEDGSTCIDADVLAGGGASVLNDLTDAYTIYDAGTTSNVILARPGAVALTTGAIHNLFIGENAGATSANSTAATDNNVAIGFSTLSGLTTGDRNIAVGTYGLSNNTVGKFNTALGYNALNTNVAKSNSTAIGYEAMANAHSSAVAADANNTAIGYQALYGSGTASANTGVNNNAIGANALQKNTIGANLNALGVSALQNNTTGAFNIAIGNQAGENNESGGNNILIGQNAGRGAFPIGNSNIGDNVIIGSYTAQVIETGANLNVIVGHSSASAITSGISNVFIGQNTGDTLEDGDNNILIGAGVDIPTASTNSFLNIGNVVYGDMASNEVHISAPAAAPADADFGNSSWSLWLDEASDQFELKGKKSDGSVITQTVGQASAGSLDIDDLGDAATNYATDFNMFLGQGAGANIGVGGQYNVFLGQDAGNDATVADSNIAIGYNALHTNVAKTNITAIGSEAMRYANSNAVNAGAYNTAVGTQALYGSTTAASNTGTNNAAFGALTLKQTTSGSNNTALGDQSMFNNTTGSENTAVGSLTFYTNEAKKKNTAVGFHAMRYANDNTTIADTNNTAVGALALYGSGTASANSGTNNTAIGASALVANTGGGSNVAVGVNAGAANTAGNNNVYIGQNAAPSNESSQNTIIGYQAGFNSVSGLNNSYFGYQAGIANITGDNNIMIGSGVNAPTNATSNFMNIGNTIYADLSTDRVGIGTNAPNAALHAISDAATTAVMEAYSNTGIIGPTFTMGRGRGTTATPLIVNNLDVLGSSLVYGYDGDSDEHASSIVTYVDGTPADGDMPSGMLFKTRAPSSVLTSTKMNIESEGDIRMDTNTGALVLHSGITAERPGADGRTDVNGMIRYNTTNNKFEAYENAAWTNMIGGGATTAAGADRQIQFNSGGTAFGAHANFSLAADARLLLEADKTGADNVFISGGPAADTLGNFNIALGMNSLINLDGTCATGSECDGNTALGHNTGRDTTTGYRNTWVGMSAGLLMDTGFDNVGVGYSVLENNLLGRYHTVMGSFAMESFVGSASDVGNVAIGKSALQGNQVTPTLSVGDKNVAIGAVAGTANEAGASNIFIGARAGDANTDGSNNVILGSEAGRTLVSGSNNIVIGQGVDVPAAATASYLNIGNLIYGDLANNEVFLDAPAAAAPDGDLANGQLTFWVDAANDEIELKARDSAGDLINVTVGAGGSGLWTDNTTYISRSGDVMVDGTHTDVASVPVSGAGTRMFFDVDMSAFRAGRVSGTQWDNGSLGENSIALGRDLTASGENSIALGAFSASTAYASIAIGQSVTASGSRAVAMGLTSTASANQSFAMGDNPTASAGTAVAFGWDSVASGVTSFTMGNASVASATQSVAFGSATVASGAGSFAFGSQAKAGDGIFVSADNKLGSQNPTIGNRSVVFGLQTAAQTDDPIVTGDRSFVVMMDGGTIDANSTYDFTESDKFAIIGGEFQIDDVSGSANKGCIRYDSANTKLQFSHDCSTYADLGSGGGGTPGGVDTQVQFNDGGAFGGDAGMVFNKTTDILTVGELNATDRISLGVKTSIGTPTGMGLDNLTDVALVSASNGECLVFDGTNWVDGACGGGSSLWTDNTTYISRAGDVLVSGTYSGTASVPVSGAGTRMFFDVETGAFRAGTASLTEWDNGSIGNNSFAAGWGTTASGGQSISLGNGTTAIGANSVALNNGSNATGTNSLATGYYTTATLDNSTAMGQEVKATAINTFAIGLAEQTNTDGDRPQVSGAGSMGIFMDQTDSYNLSTTDTFGIIGGEIMLDDDGSTASTKGCIRFDDTAGVLQYSNDCSSYSDFGSGGGGSTEVSDATGTLVYGDNTGASNWTNGSPASGAFSGNTSTTAHHNGNITMIYAGKDWGAGNTKVISSMTLTGRPSLGFVNPSNPTVTFYLDGSNDGSSWTDLGGSQAITDTNTTTIVTITPSSTTAYRYHRARLTQPSGGQNMGIGEVDLFETPSGGGALSDITAATASSTISNLNHEQQWLWDTLGSQTAMALKSGSINSGTILEVSSAASGMTGTMFDVNLGGNNAGNTGTLVKSSVIGTSSAAVPMMVTNLGTGLSFRVNDETGDGDTSPFVIDSAGWVGIGTTTPTSSSALDVTNLTSDLLVHLGAASTFKSTLRMGSGSNTFRIVNDDTADLVSIGGDSGDTLDMVLNASNQTNQLFLKQSSGNVGIGINDPNYKLDVQGSIGTNYKFEAIRDGNSALALLYSYRDSQNHSKVQMRGARGSVATPVVLSANDLIGELKYDAWMTGTTYGDSATIQAVASELHTATSTPANLELRTTPSGATSDVVRMTIEAAGLVDVVGSIKVGDGGETCSGGETAYPGAIRYSSTNDTIEFCKDNAGSADAWTDLAAGGGGGGTPGGANTQVQFNNGGAFAGDSGMVFDSTNDILTVGELAATDKISLAVKTSIGTPTFPSGGGGALDDLSDAATSGGGTNNMFIGHEGGSFGAADFRNLAIGGSALDALNNTGALNNLAIGYQALSANTGGDSNLAIGYQSMVFNQTGVDNVAIGQATLLNNVSGGWNVAVGKAALQNNTGSANTALGRQALYTNSGGSSNVAIGYDAVLLNASGNYNIGVGREALRAATGSNNIAIGYQAGDLTTNASDNILIGHQVDAPTATTSNHLNIGNLIYGDLSSNEVFLDAPAAAPADGDLSNGQITFWVDATNDEIELKAKDSAGDIVNVTVGGGGSSVWTSGTGNDIYYNTGTPQVGINNASPDVELDVTGDIEYSGTLTDVSDRRLKDNITPLNEHGSLLDRIDDVKTYSFTMKDDETGRLEFGVMAQELEEIFPELVKTADDEMGTKSVNYMGLIAPMIEATKELKAENETLKAEVETMNAEKQDVHATLESLAKQVELLNKAANQNVGKASMLPTTQSLLYILLGMLSTLCLVLVITRKKA